MGRCPTHKESTALEQVSDNLLFMNIMAEGTVSQVMDEKDLDIFLKLASNDREPSAFWYI